jgi:RNA polymerase sigma factor (sigma-70 family)
MSSSSIVHADLRERALAGDGAALNALCKELEAPVFRLCLRMLGHVGDAEDAAQDILIKVVTHLAQFDGRSALTTWVHTIAVRHLLERRKSRAETVALDEEAFAALLDKGLAYGATQPAPGPEDRAFVKEVRLSCTQGMLLLLSREERLALVLVDLLGFDGAEAAVVAGASHDAFRQRLGRARARRGEFLQRRCGLVNDDAACRCEKQVAGKKTQGTSVRFLPLYTDERMPAPAATRAAQEELRQLGAVSRAFHQDGMFDAPESLHEKIVRLLPSIL